MQRKVEKKHEMWLLPQYAFLCPWNRAGSAAAHSRHLSVEKNAHFVRGAFQSHFQEKHMSWNDFYFPEANIKRQNSKQI